MKKKHDLLVQATRALHVRLLGPAIGRSQQIDQRLTELLQECQSVCRLGRRYTVAQERCWSELQARLRSELLGCATQMQLLTQQLIATRDQAVPRAPPVGLLLAELRQLQEEFDQSHIDPKTNAISADTDPIVLEGIPLGPFAIVLRLEELTTRRDSTCFECVALKPYPASHNSSITHPHVSDGVLCAGDASLAIASALADGRLCEAFLLVRSVLSTYNPQSPYVSLSDWEDGHCCDCNCNVASQDLYRCEACRSYFCESCISRCDVCDRSCCNSCLSRDCESDRYCCENCCQNCSVCHRIVETDNVDVVSGMCPQCIDQSGPGDSDEVNNPDRATAEPPVPASVAVEQEPDSDPSRAPTDPSWILVCECQSSESYPEVVYAALRIDVGQAAALLGLRNTLRLVEPCATAQAVDVRDTRVNFAIGFSVPYEEARVDWDLCPWHTVASDPLLRRSDVNVELDTMHITPQGIAWSVQPSHDHCQIIQTDTLLWSHLETLAAGHSPFPQFQPEPAAPPHSNDTGR